MRRKISLFLILFGLSVVNARAYDYKNIEGYDAGIWTLHESSTHTFLAGQISTHQVMGLVLSLSVETIGADAAYNVEHSSGYQVSPSGNAWKVFTSSTIHVLSGSESSSPNITGRVYNPKIHITSLGSGGTAYVRAETLLPND